MQSGDTAALNTSNTGYAATSRSMGSSHRSTEFYKFCLTMASSPGFGTADPSPPKLDPPRLVWEYWDGTAWQGLLGPSS